VRHAAQRLRSVHDNLPFLPRSLLRLEGARMLLEHAGLADDEALHEALDDLAATSPDQWGVTWRRHGFAAARRRAHASAA